MVGGRERGFARGVGWTVTLVEEGQPVAPPHSRAIPWAPLRRPEISVGSWLGVRTQDWRGGPTHIESLVTGSRKSNVWPGHTIRFFHQSQSLRRPIVAERPVEAR